MKTYSGEEWFEHHFGFHEDLDNVYKYIRVEQREGHIEIISQANGKHFSAGIFNLRTPSHYRHLQPRGNGRFHVIHGRGGKSIEDVLRQQNDPDYDGATFQVASNFNCLEFPHRTMDATQGISYYAEDGTQGPRVAIGSPGAALYRNYFVDTGDRCGQINREINLLIKTPIRVIHGKAQCMKEEVRELSNFNFADEELYLAGVHENVGINTNATDRGKWIYTDSKPGIIAHQVYVAAFQFPKFVETPETLEWTRHMLRSEYRTTILAAWDHSIRYSGRKGSNKCVLTLVGGGCFQNPFSVICEAIANNEDVIIASGLDVYLVCFTDEIFNEVYPYVADLRKKTGGSVIEASDKSLGSFRFNFDRVNPFGRSKPT